MMVSTVMKENIYLIGASLQFRGLVHYCHGKNHGAEQANMVLEKKLKVLHLDLQAAGD